jgi:flagellar basal-body rod modification protein FlgD
MTISPISDLTQKNEAAPAKAGNDPAVNKDTFLQLLVAQIKNQNPLSPADGVQFLTQLAQFSEMEQMMGIRSELEGLRSDYADNNKTPPATNPGETETPEADKKTQGA